MIDPGLEEYLDTTPKEAPAPNIGNPYGFERGHYYRIEGNVYRVNFGGPNTLCP